MGKRLRHVTRKKSPVVMPERMHALRSAPLNETQKERALCDQLKSIFESLPESIIVCNQAGKIVWLNAAALKLFEMSARARWKGTSYQQFIGNYQPCDEQQRPITAESWLINPVGGKENEYDRSSEYSRGSFDGFQHVLGDSLAARLGLYPLRHCPGDGVTSGDGKSTWR